jgi:hypothetical protein
MHVIFDSHDSFCISVEWPSGQHGGAGAYRDAELEGPGDGGAGDHNRDRGGSGAFFFTVTRRGLVPAS